jgi:formylglycine-generating enzyme required for sulfatase activity
LDSDSGPEVNEGDSGSDGPAPTSCVAAGPGLTNCGPAGSGTESCCTSLEVQGGTYDRTYTSEADGGAVDQADPATVNRFRLDKYDVTVGRFRQYVNYLIDGGSPPADGSGRHNHLNGGQGLTSGAAGGGRYEAGWDATDWNANIATGPAAAGTWNTNLACEAGYDTWTSEPSNQENLPINCVNWYEAYAFCIWDGGFLPSEAEWEYVAAGGSQEREYPWGSADPGSTNQYAIYDAYYTADSTDIAPVGTATLGAAAWGQLDMAGEVYEWNLDWYAAYADPCDNCANLSSTEQAEAAGTTASRVFRGGNVNSVEAYLVPSLRYFNDPTYRAYGLGLRCARTP